MAIDPKEYPNKIKANLWGDGEYKVFYYNFKLNTKKYRGLIDARSNKAWGKRERVTYAEAELARIKERMESPLDYEVTLDNYIRKYFDLQKQTEYTKGRYRHYEMYVSPVCGKVKLCDLRSMHIKESLKLQEQKGLAARTKKQTLEVLNPAMKAAIADRLIVYNPCDGVKIKLPKTKKIVTNASTRLMEIYDAIKRVYGNDPFYFALYLFALQGRRRGEILGLRWDDVSMEHGYYVLRNTKNNEEQKIFLPHVIKEQLVKIPRINEWVFASYKTGGHLVDIRKATDKIKRELGDDNFGIHYLRNVIVSAMAEQGFDSIHLSGALGHNDPNTIKKYLTMNYLKSSEMASGVIDGIVKR